MKVKKLLSTVTVTLLAVLTLTLTASAASYDKDLSQSYDFTNGSVTLGYDVGSIFPYDDVWGWTH